jgi:hypothetical protein
MPTNSYRNKRKNHYTDKKSQKKLNFFIRDADREDKAHYAW